MPGEVYDDYRKWLEYIATLPLYVDDTGNPTLRHIQARCEFVSRTDGLLFIGIDYDEKVGEESRVEELRVSKIAQGAKAIAKRYNAPLLLLSQYNRDSMDPNSRPRDKWLRYSDKKKHESAMVLHWWWPGYWVVNEGLDPTQSRILKFDPSMPMRGYLVCTKNRFGGQLGSVELDFDREHVRFVDPADPRNRRMEVVNGSPF